MSLAPYMNGAHQVLDAVNTQPSPCRHTRCHCQLWARNSAGKHGSSSAICTWAEVHQPWRQQDNVIWQIPVCASEKMVPVQTVIPWEPVMGAGNTENSNFPVKWGRMIHEIFKSHPLYHAVSSTEVHGHLMLLWPPLPSTSGISIGKSSSQITPGTNTFILVWIPVSCLGRAQLADTSSVLTYPSIASGHWVYPLK